MTSVKKMVAVVTCFLASSVTSQTIRSTKNTLTIKNKETDKQEYDEKLVSILNYMDVSTYKSDLQLSSTMIIDPDDFKKNKDGVTKLCYLDQADTVD